MPSYFASIEVMLKPLVNDPQGLAVLDGLKNLGFQGAERVRVGKRIEITLEASSSEVAQQSVTEMCRQLLANPVIEDFRFDLEEVEVVAGD